jgi:formate-dependent phosphoribosylglycinamide formyltransferase (GAR transformylase)
MDSYQNLPPFRASRPFRDITRREIGSINPVNNERKDGQYGNSWQPPRDSNPDTLLQRQMSYH